MKLRTVGILGLIVVMIGVGGAVATRQVTGSVFGGVAGGKAPSGVRVRVQVLNATSVRGLARRATDVLRDRGFDVVEVGTSREQSDSTFVLDRSGHPEWSKRVAAAMGGASVISRPDTSRYLDVTVLVGARWRPPSKPFHP